MSSFASGTGPTGLADGRFNSVLKSAKTACENFHNLLLQSAGDG